MKLYGYYRSSAAYRVRIALNLKAVPHTHVPVHMYRDGGGHHTAAYGAKNPQHLVPTLELEDGTCIGQSLAIIEYLDTTQPGPRLIPSDPVLAAKVRAASFVIACDVHPLNNLRVMNYLKKPLGHSEAEVMAWYQHWILNGGLDALEKLVGDGPFCFGDTPGLADCCLVPQLYNARRFGVPLQGLDRLLAIDARCRALPAFDLARPEVQPDAE